MLHSVIGDYLKTLPTPTSERWNWDTQLILPGGRKVSLRDIVPDYVGIISEHRGNKTKVGYGYSEEKGGNFDQFIICQGDPEEMVGGVNVIPWTRINGKLYVLVLEQDRPLMTHGKKVWGPPGGFKDPLETYSQAVVRLTKLKTGLDIKERLLVSLVGVPVTTNRAFFLTRGKRSDNDGGDRHYAYYLEGDLFVEDQNDVWRLRNGNQGRLVELFPLENLLGSADAVLIVGVARLLPYLCFLKEISIYDNRNKVFSFWMAVLFLSIGFILGRRTKKK